MKLFFLLIVCLVVLCEFASAAKGAAPGSDIQTPKGATFLKIGPKGSKLYKLNTEGSIYDDAPYLLNLVHGSNYEQGYDTAYLMGDKFIENYNKLMISMLGDEWWEPAVAGIVSKFLNWQWNSYLKLQLPDEYLDEIRGMTNGGQAAGYSEDIGAIAGWGIVLANFPGSLENLVYILKDEKEHPHRRFDEDMLAHGLSMEIIEAMLKKIKKNWNGLTCSMFGVWGSRTDQGKLFTGRNLDWLKDSGISTSKLITIHRPQNGYAHATIGWAGIWGAITGISSKGITVHEANLESNDISFRGFPWVLRLRHIMAHAQNLDEALNLWKSTQSTVGFNHGIGSAADKQAVCLETMHGNDAIFHANDPREQNLVIDGQQIGLARPEAVYRTNHGYDAYTIQHYMWNNTNAYKNSIERYKIFPEQFDSYASQQVKISHKEAVSITALVGEKGLDHIYDCNGPFDAASNILSVTYDPAEVIAYMAWENGHKSTWTPAACNTYLAVDLKPWFDM